MFRVQGYFSKKGATSHNITITVRSGQIEYERAVRLGFWHRSKRSALSSVKYLTSGTAMRKIRLAVYTPFNTLGGIWF